MPVTYTATDAQDLDSIAPLWEKLRAHHRERSGPFKGRIDAMTWEARKRQLLEKSAGGGLRLDIARDGDTTIGYGITVVDAGKRAELESIFIEPDYRHRGIGTVFMEKALAWMDETGAVRREIGIAAGNQEVIAFYRRFGFEPRTVVMEQVDRE